MAEKQSLWNTEILASSLLDSVRKLDPRGMVKNPVMFVVEVGSVLTTALLIDNVIHHRPGFGFNLQITLWLWFTVLFANFAEAMAEGRGKAQADTLRKAKGETVAAPATSSTLLPEAILPATAKSSKASRPSTNLPLPASPRLSFAKRAETAAPSQAAPRSSPIGSRSKSPPTPAKPSSTA
jgi:high-affinity K+ transport system ATPase subunit B